MYPWAQAQWRCRSPRREPDPARKFSSTSEWRPWRRRSEPRCRTTVLARQGGEINDPPIATRLEVAAKYLAARKGAAGVGGQHGIEVCGVNLQHPWTAVRAALLTSTSTDPQRSMHLSSTLWKSSGLVTSRVADTAVSPARSSSEASASAGSGSMSEITTRKPALCRARTASAPKPRAPPVTTAVWILSGAGIVIRTNS